MTVASRLAALERRIPEPSTPPPGVDWAPMIVRLAPAERAELDELLVRCGPTRRHPDGRVDLDHVVTADLKRLAYFAQKAEDLAREVGASP
jgi:hypothetical protein